MTCPALSLSDGDISYNKSPVDGGYPEYTYATFTCKYGYALDGPFRSDCQRSGAWDKQSPTCNKGSILAKLSVKALGYPSEMI